MGEAAKIDPSDLYAILSAEINTFLFDRPETRDRVMDDLVRARKEDGRVIYIDLDTTFTALLRMRAETPENLTIIAPKGEEIEEALLSLLSWTRPELQLLVIDSVTTFTHVVSGLADFPSKNRRLGYYLSLMREFALWGGAPVLVTSHLGYRRSADNSWAISYAGGRVLEHHSSSIFGASSVNGEISLTVMKSADARLTGRKMMLLKALEREEKEPQEESDGDE